MPDEVAFRLVAVLGLAAVLPLAAYHRIKARTGERLDRRQEGVAPAVALRLTGLAHMVTFVLWLAAPAWTAWAQLPLPAAARWSGVGVGAVAAALIAWTLRHLGGNLTDTVVTRAHHTLVTSGPYHFIRHPFYVSAGLAMTANSLLAANALLLVTGAIVFSLMAWRSGREERNLAARFGEAYARYQQRTGRFLPRLWHAPLVQRPRPT